MNTASLTVLLVFGIPLVAIAGHFAVKVVKILRADSSPASKKARAEETRLIQEIHRGLSKMEQRVEALETILFDQPRKEDKT